ncbi:MAG: hypothetical protein GXP31_15605 [Kiritimatiellaeota bacterium]|nr:hypothetical protein [Kiritimatiellota bacterium]
MSNNSRRSCSRSKQMSAGSWMVLSLFLLLCTGRPALAWSQVRLDIAAAPEGLLWASGLLAEKLSIPLGNLGARPAASEGPGSLLQVSWPAAADWGGVQDRLGQLEPGTLGTEGFALVRSGEDYLIVGNTPIGAMYGVVELLQRLGDGRPPSARQAAEIQTPRLRIRGEAQSLPFWLGTTMYAGNWSGYGKQENTADWYWFDKAYWRRLFRRLAMGRENALLYWHPHPFAAFVSLPAYPAANYFPPSLQVAYQRQFHWILRTGLEYGVHIYLLTWNICVLPRFAEAHPDVQEFGSDTPMVRKYTAYAVKRLFNEFPELGFATMAAETPPGCVDFVLKALVAPLNSLKRKPRFIFWTWCTYPDEAKRVVDAYQGPSEVMHYLQYEQLFIDKVDPRVAKTAETTGREVVCIGGLGADTGWQYWCDLPFLHNLIADLPAKQSCGVFFQGLDSFEFLAARPLAHDALGKFLWRPEVPFDPSFWKTKLSRRYASQPLGENLWRAMCAGSGITPRFVQLVHSQTDHYVPQLGLPLVNFLEQPTLNTYVFENHDTVGRDGLLHPNMGLSWPNPDWGRELQGVKAYVDAAKTGRRSKGETPLEVAADLQHRADTTAKALRVCTENLKTGHVQKVEEARAICNLLNMNVWLGRYYAAKIRAAVAWEMWRRRIAPERNRKGCLAALDRSLAAWRELCRWNRRLHLGTFGFWRSEVNVEPPWNHWDIWRGYVLTKGNFCTQLPFFERERGLVAGQLAGAPETARLPLWRDLAPPPRIVRVVAACEFEHGLPDFLVPGPEALVQAVKRPGTVISGKYSLLLETRGNPKNWTLLASFNARRLPLQRGRHYRLEFDYGVLATGAPENRLGVGAHSSAGWQHDIGTNRFIKLRKGARGHWFIDFTPKKFDDYQVFWSIEKGGAVVLDAVRLLETAPPVTGKPPAKRGAGGAPW